MDEKKEAVKARIIEGIEFVRDTSTVNMFQANVVRRIAFDNGYYELVNLIEEDKKVYSHIILTGEFPEGYEPK